MFNRLIQIYTCVLLTLIAAMLFVLLSRPYEPVTLQSVRSRKVRADQIPLVRVHSGNIDVGNTVDVNVESPVEVTGSVSIDR